MKFLILIFLFTIIFAKGCLDPVQCDLNHNYFENYPVFNSHRHVIITYNNYYIQLNVTAPQFRPDPDHDQPTEYYIYYLLRCGCPSDRLPKGRPIISIPVKDIGNTALDVYPMLSALEVEDRLTLAIEPRYIATQRVVDNLLQRMIKGEKLYFVGDFDPRSQDAEVSIISFFNFYI